MQAADFWDWLVHSDMGLMLRVGAGVAIFTVFAFVEYRRRGRSARRWKEYLFLIYCTLAMMIFGVINDQVTVSVSWEYFVYGKEFPGAEAGRPDEWTLRVWACEIGLKATWTAGLILGAILLICNNPARRDPIIPMRSMLGLVWAIFIPAAVLAAILGIAGYFGAWKDLTDDFRYLWSENLLRPRTFMAVWGMHLGAYIGGFLGSTGLAGWILKKRFTSRRNDADSKVFD